MLFGTARHWSTLFDGELRYPPPIPQRRRGAEETRMQPSLLEELTPVPNPYPVVATVAYPEVWDLCVAAHPDG